MSYTLHIDAGSSRPKYQQIADALLAGITSKNLGIDEQLPSINEISAQYDVSRDTVERAYKVLKRDGVIISVRGKGYYASASEQKINRKVLVIFNKLSDHKREILEGLAEEFGDDVDLELQIYYDDFRSFERIIDRHHNHFSDFVIIPSFVGSGQQRARELINTVLAKRNVVIVSAALGATRPGVASVTQDYEADIIAGLDQAHDLLGKYNRVVLLFDPDCSARGIIQGFQTWSESVTQSTEILTTDQSPDQLEKGTAYVCVTDRQLVQLVKNARDQNFELGRDIGLVAYNDSVLKEVLANGITVITTAHRRMGTRAAELLRNNISAHERVPFRLIRRATL